MCECLSITAGTAAFTGISSMLTTTLLGVEASAALTITGVSAAGGLLVGVPAGLIVASIVKCVCKLSDMSDSNARKVAVAVGVLVSAAAQTAVVALTGYATLSGAIILSAASLGILAGAIVVIALTILLLKNCICQDSNSYSAMTGS